MIERTVTVGGKDGLHARPAAAFVKAASKYKSKVQLNCRGRKINAKSTIDMMMTGASVGELIIMSVDGEDEAAAFLELSGLIEGRAVDKQ